MREFSDINRELGLKKFLTSHFSTLYFVPFSSRAPRIMVRHFNIEISPDSVEHVAAMIQASKVWVERHDLLTNLVKIEQPIEVGRDFIARQYHLYSASTDAYVDWEEPPEVPEELERMRRGFTALIGKSTDPADVFIETFLAKSLLEPSGKTYFDEIRAQFIVGEPRLTREDIEQWSKFRRR